MQKTYTPELFETHWSSQWEKEGYFKPKNNGKPYCIMLPPPNVTGSLHMGHGFQVSLMDALVRYHRMLGENVLWQGGTDHAGIATQMVVERQLIAKGEKRTEIGRANFLKAVWEWKEKSGGRITHQLRRLGSSIDWSRERFTRDPEFSEAVTTAFISLHNQQLIYRGKRLVNWDPVLLSAVSDLEVINTEAEGRLWYIRYPLVESDSYIIVATTRPETIFGDVAVAVNPNDPRYKQFIGQHLKLPLTTRLIPIIADESVVIEFGTGCVKITPAHDFNDYLVGQKHQLPLLNIFTPTAHLNENVPLPYQGLERFVAREKIINALQADTLLEKTEAYSIKIPHGDRSGAILEPFLTDQWFINMAPLAQNAITSFKEGGLKFFPENWETTYLLWLNNIQDWCISRQLWWGHRIPAWYDPEGKVYVGINEDEIRQSFSLAPEIILTQDQDVLDTWFSAALWPFVTLGWPKKTRDYLTFFPTNLLVTGFDIIFFWVARMVMFSLHFTKQIPFNEIYITGLIRDQEGQKMSKSKGNVIDPLDIIEGISLEDLIDKRTEGLMQPQMRKKIEYATRQQFPNGINAFGADALRLTYCSLASPTRDIHFDLGRTEGFRNFCNKLWNATRFVLMHTTDDYLNLSNVFDLSIVDQWIRSRLQATIESVKHHFETYRFDLLIQTLYEFTWNEFCDWYLEFCKPHLSDSLPRYAQGSRYTLLTTLEVLLRLLHPVMPFITEEIWQKIAPMLNKVSSTIMLAPYPNVDLGQRNRQIENEIEWLKALILLIRHLRNEIKLSPSSKIMIFCWKGENADKQRTVEYAPYLKQLVKVEKIEWLAPETTPPAGVMGLLGQMQILIPLEGFKATQQETVRLNKELTRWKEELKKTQVKLANTLFVTHAPPLIVEQEKKRAEEFQIKIEKILSQLDHLSNG